MALDLVGDGVAEGVGDRSGLDAHPELADEVDLFLGADESAFLLKS